MKRDQVLAILFDNRDALRRRGVVRAAVFGSTVRGDASPTSDIDILVDIDPDANIGVYEYVALTRFLEELFPAPVDIANRETLKSHIRPSAERDAVYAF